MNTKTISRLLDLRESNDDHAALMAALRPRFARLAGRHENGTAPVAVSAFQLFQTPPVAAARLVELLNPTPGARILEPSAGLGRILDALAPYQPSEIVAVEMAAPCAGELFRQDRKGVAIKQADFLTLTPDHIGLFDFIAMNPPFHMRSDIKHIKHAIQFLKPGGRLGAICFNQPNRQAILKPMSTAWEPLPSSSFRKEGTNVDTAICIIQAP